MEVKIYGSRGTMPFSGGNNIRYGGNTSCIRVDVSGETIIIDCGSGLARFHTDITPRLKQGENIRLSILLSHLHLDHICGLSAFSPLFNGKHDIRIFTKSRDVRPLASQIFGIFRPPYWPVELEKMNCAKLTAINEDEPFTLSDGIKITPFSARHQDGTTAFRIEADKTLIYLLDYEINEDTDPLSGPLLEYCRNADLIIFDSSYLPEDYEKKRGWGHSTYKAAIGLAKRCGCKKMILCHLHYEYSDNILDLIAEKVKNNGHLLAYDGMELSI